MSYSRWSNSFWYTFWSSSCSSETLYKFPSEKLKRAQCFEICDIGHVTYGDLVDMGVEEFVRTISDKYSKPHMAKEINYDMFFDNGNKFVEKEMPGMTFKVDDLSELCGYMKLFMKDVDDHFRLSNFFLYEWYYPVRNNVKRFFIKMFANKNE